jgi:surfeit locus 1 family protein
MSRPVPNPSDTVMPARRRLVLRVLPTLATVVGIAVFVAAGQWQQRRMHEKEALRAQEDAAALAPPLMLDLLPDTTDWSALRYRHVSVTGSFDAGHQVFIDNKVHDERVGYHVVTPLTLPDGRTVLVDRGWVAQGASRSVLPAAAPPPGAVTVVGRIAVPPRGYLELERDATTGPVRQNLDPARFAAASGVAVLPVVIEATASSGAGDDLVRDWPAPDFGIDKHRIYMMQWYGFAALAAGLWLSPREIRCVTCHPLHRKSFALRGAAI